MSRPMTITNTTPAMPGGHAQPCEHRQKLVAAGANPNVVNTQGRTPLSYGAERRSPEMVKLLLAAKADPMPQGRAPAGRHFSKDAVSAELLLQAGPNPVPSVPSTLWRRQLPALFKIMLNISPRLDGHLWPPTALGTTPVEIHADRMMRKPTGSPSSSEFCPKPTSWPRCCGRRQGGSTDPAGNQRTPLWYAANATTLRRWIYCSSTAPIPMPATRTAAPRCLPRPADR